MSGLHERSYMNKSAVLEYDYEFNKQTTSSIRNRVGRMEQTLSTICALHEHFNSDFLNGRIEKNQKNSEILDILEAPGSEISKPWNLKIFGS